MPPPPVEVVVTIVEDLPTMMAAAEADVPAEEEALLMAKALPAQAPTKEPAAALTDIQVPAWNLGERIPIAPQVWDVDTPPIGVGAVEDDVDIVTLEDSEITPVAPEPPWKLPKERKKKRQKRAAQRDEDGRLVIWLTEECSAQTADAAEDEGRPNQTTDNFGARTVHSAEEDAVLATDVASVQRMSTPVLGTDEVRSTDGREPVEGQVDTPGKDQLPESNGARNPVDTERDTVPIIPPSSPVSTAAIVVVARQMSTTRPV
jgi:hypothetical protein